MTRMRAAVRPPLLPAMNRVLAAAAAFAFTIAATFAAAGLTAPGRTAAGPAASSGAFAAGLWPPTPGPPAPEPPAPERAAAAHLAVGRAVAAHQAAVTRAQQERVLRYWTPTRMAAARTAAPVRLASPDKTTPPTRATRASAAHTAEDIGPMAATAPHLLPLTPRAAPSTAAAVSPNTETAGWPGGGAVARTTGKVFFTMTGQAFVCSASSVTSANADVVITAAHCVKDGNRTWATNWEFVPGFTNGSRPYGTWTARQFFLAPQWIRTGNDNDDVAFVTLNPQRARGVTVHIGQVVGGQAIAFGARLAREYAFGYPAEPPYDGTDLYYCSGPTSPDSFHSSKDTGLQCDMTAGSSGGPWLSGFDSATGRGIITSVNSFKYTTDRSTLYGPRLGVVAQALFDRAQDS